MPEQTNHMRLIVAVTSLCLAAASVASSGTPADAAPNKYATVATSFRADVDGFCHPVSTATWSGYQVNRVRHIFYLEGHTGDDAIGFTTTGYAKGSQSSGTFVSELQGFRSAGPLEGWYVRALFRSNGGAILAEATSAVAEAPAWCRQDEG